MKHVLYPLILVASVFYLSLERCFSQVTCGGFKCLTFSGLNDANIDLNGQWQSDANECWDNVYKYTSVHHPGVHLCHVDSSANWIFTDTICDNSVGHMLARCWRKRSDIRFCKTEDWRIQNGTGGETTASGASVITNANDCAHVTDNPSNAPTDNPSHMPTNNPSQDPTNDGIVSTPSPSNNPSQFPSTYPTKDSTLDPTMAPSVNPSKQPTDHPIFSSFNPSTGPTLNPVVESVITTTSPDNSGSNSGGQATKPTNMAEILNYVLVVMAVIILCMSGCCMYLAFKYQEKKGKVEAHIAISEAKLAMGLTGVEDQNANQNQYNLPDAPAADNAIIPAIQYNRPNMLASMDGGMRTQY
eukprot:237161_1